MAPLLGALGRGLRAPRRAREGGVGAGARPAGVSSRGDTE